MGRLAVRIRPATPADAQDLVDIWVTYVDGQPGRLPAPEPDEAARAIAHNALDPHETLLVADLDDRVVGVVHLARNAVSPLHEANAVQVNHLFVHPDVRRRGVGRALLAHAAAWADEKGSTHVLAAVAANSRDSNRFLACLGLTQVAVVRSVPVAVLRQRLALSEAEAADTPALQARRRTLLRRQLTRGLSAYR